MKIRVPDYYKKFVCTADECEDTCCAGWQIVADEKSLRKYKSVKGSFRKRMLRSVNWKEGTFRQSSDRRCAFLNEDNLCDMYIALGKKSLCKTCRLYPRHVEEFENVREVTLSLSCPEAAKIILSQTTPMCFATYETDREEVYPKFDRLLYANLEKARTVMLDLLQDLRIPFRTAIGLVMGIAHDLQIRVNNKEADWQTVLNKYSKESAKLFVEGNIQTYCSQKPLRFEMAKAWFSRLYDFELLKEDWYIHLKETQKLLYSDGREEYWKKRFAFEQWMEQSSLDLDWTGRQILVYFLATYFCGAVYDRRLYAKVKQAVLSWFFLKEMYLGRWLRNENMLDSEDIREVTYRYSREIEHSDSNLDMLEKMTERRKLKNI